MYFVVHIERQISDKVVFILGPIMENKGNIGAIETRYNGCRFRSRLEARWAVFFDTLGLKWEYEKEGYNLGNGIYYLPDFYIAKKMNSHEREYRIFIEIKPDNPTIDDIVKMGLFANYLGQNRDSSITYFAYLFLGYPNTPDKGKGGVDFWRYDAEKFKNPDIHQIGSECWSPYQYFTECPHCGQISIMGFQMVHIDWFKKKFPDPNTYLRECGRCGKNIINFESAKSKRIKYAIEAAKSARFEFGESG